MTIPIILVVCIILIGVWLFLLTPSGQPDTEPVYITLTQVQEPHAQTPTDEIKHVIKPPEVQTTKPQPQPEPEPITQVSVCSEAYLDDTYHTAFNVAAAIHIGDLDCDISDLPDKYRNSVANQDMTAIEYYTEYAYGLLNP